MITTDPTSAYGTLGENGVMFAVDPNTGEIEQVPYTGTSPYGEPALFQSPEVPAAIPFEANQRIDVAAEDEFLHEQLHGTPWHGYEILEWVNPENPGIPNLGPPNEQDFQSGHTSIVVHNSSAEQGWGMDPALLVARYPKVQNTNPFYATGTHRRNGEFPWAVAGLPFADLTQQNVQLSHVGRRRTSSVHGKLADIPPFVPYSENVVPVQGNAGPLNLIPDGAEGIY